MANKPAPRNWNDIQVVIATISMAFTLAFWNTFAGPDRASALKRAQEQAAIPPQPIATEAPIVVAPTPLGDGKLLFGGNAPQTQIIVHSGGGGGGGNTSGGGGNTGGGAPVTSTKSS